MSQARSLCALKISGSKLERRILERMHRSELRHFCKALPSEYYSGPA